MFKLKGKDRSREQVKLWTLTFDEERGEYIRTEQKMERGELPPDALKVEKLKRTYLLDRVGCPDPDPAAPGAISLNLWMVNNSISDAFSTKWHPGKLGMEEMKKILVIAFVGIVACCVLYALM